MPEQTSVVTEGRDTEEVVPVYVGQVTGYFHRFRAARVEIAQGAKLMIGDRIRFGPRPGAAKPRTRIITVARLERRFHQLPEAGPGAVAVYTGHDWIAIGTPVFRLVPADPTEL